MLSLIYVVWGKKLEIDHTHGQVFDTKRKALLTAISLAKPRARLQRLSYRHLLQR